MRWVLKDEQEFANLDYTKPWLKFWFIDSVNNCHSLLPSPVISDSGDYRGPQFQSHI